MPRPTGTRSLADLLEAGALRVGEPLVINRQSQPSVEGALQADGSIKVGRQTFRTPSGAAKEVLDVGSVDGWIRWRVPRLNNKSLAMIREEA